MRSSARLLALSMIAACLMFNNLRQNAATAAVTSTDARMHLGSSAVPVRQWSDGSSKPKAIIVAVHGALRSSGTFQPLAEQLAANGYLIVSPDLRGHGDWYFSAKTAQEKIVDYDESAQDVVNLFKAMRNEHPLTPIFCMGESAGGIVALQAAGQFPTINGLILSSIGTRPCIHDVQNIVRDFFLGLAHFDQPLDVRETMAKYASDDPQTAKDAASDPMLKPGFSAREMLRTARLLNQANGFASKLPDHIPVLMQEGRNRHAFVCDARAQAHSV
jgi:alpha-beta hydrolase superfamily lysophospholipase